MIIQLKKETKPQEIKDFIKYLENKGYQIKDASSQDLTLLGVIGDTSKLDIGNILSFSIVEEAHRIATPFKQVSRSFHPLDTVVEVKGIKIGGNNPLFIIGGPCSVETCDLLKETAIFVKESGAKGLRGGAYKPRTSPYAFQGLGTIGVEYLNTVSNEVGIITVSEIMSSDKIPEFEKNIDIFQVGARNMQNYELLKALGKTKAPILLKRGFSNTIEEWLMSAEYIIASGNPNVILCERGIRTFETYTRNTLDISVIPLIKKLTHLPIIIDPSHATGKRDLVEAVSLASIAAGCDGLIIEVHPHPEVAYSDGAQTINYDSFKTLMKKATKIAKVIGRGV
ncbi:MAG: 3-deoxy-7-phosphoheptulonate synthase [Acholeplasmatales bacterium]|jgi:3-deoxy-7-phosphoheptulonate synthase|nr:3-deoxy-7-phosphoheptulonate synthase [Acholeplasmatales bacterium]